MWAEFAWDACVEEEAWVHSVIQSCSAGCGFVRFHSLAHWDACIIEQGVPCCCWAPEPRNHRLLLQALGDSQRS